MREILVATKKREILRTVGEEKVAYLTQYDSFMGIRDDIRGLLKML